MTEFQRLQEELNRLPEEQRENIAAELLHELEEIRKAGTITEKLDELSQKAGEDRAGVRSLPLEPVPFERIKHLAGILEGPGDLSTNPNYMEGFGRSSLR